MKDIWKPPKNNRQMYDSKAWVDWLSYICLLFVMTVRLGWTDSHTFVSYLYDSKAWVDWVPYICLLLLGLSNICNSVCVLPTFLIFGCIINFDMLFLVMGFISFAHEFWFMLISSHHFRSHHLVTKLLSRIQDIVKIFLELVTYNEYACDKFL